MVRHSPFHDEERLRSAVLSSSTKKEILQKLGLRAAGGNYKSLTETCARLDIALPIYVAKPPASHSFPDEAVFVVDSTYNNRQSLKKRLFASGVPNVCNSCGQLPEWNGKPLVLTLEHKNGIWNDNRRENLEILCGHCHSQTDTFAGRSFVRTARHLCRCGKSIHKTSTVCHSCNGENRETVQWPDVKTLLEMVSDTGYSQVGRSLGVSDSAVRKRIKNHENDRRVEGA